ncbi:hypothetical protein VCRA2110O182_10138 [Vibrio crassostreae]|nr:hypothetical protein VCRA2110O182_10138 [Vibrio crassostreae]
MEQGLMMSGTLEGIAKAKRFNKEQMLKRKLTIEPEPEKNAPRHEVVANNDEYAIEEAVIDNSVQTVDEISKGLFGVVKRKLFKLLRG